MTAWLGIRIMCRSEVTCLPADCYTTVSKHYKIPNQRISLVQSGPHHHHHRDHHHLIKI
jgi:hypothetical protein